MKSKADKFVCEIAGTRPIQFYDFADKNPQFSSIVLFDSFNYTTWHVSWINFGLKFFDFKKDWTWTLAFKILIIVILASRKSVIFSARIIKFWVCWATVKKNMQILRRSNLATYYVYRNLKCQESHQKPSEWSTNYFNNILSGVYYENIYYFWHRSPVQHSNQSMFSPLIVPPGETHTARHIYYI